LINQLAKLSTDNQQVMGALVFPSWKSRGQWRLLAGSWKALMSIAKTNRGTISALMGTGTASARWQRVLQAAPSQLADRGHGKRAQALGAFKANPASLHSCHALQHGSVNK